ncbi:hypothetical protein G7Y89_g2395 [Cudoniella acicularis]|uniref:Protein kinase domain-containing protein n=1 Tax=Cudoniella acicularis TaxID=354080 RepID=A0A8H4RTE3_9HELO|nr:hypothetical protein G7Y89_g2395 [Cudoniella acicularis]
MDPNADADAQVLVLRNRWRDESWNSKLARAGGTQLGDLVLTPSRGLPELHVMSASLHSLFIAFLLFLSRLLNLLDTTFDFLPRCLDQKQFCDMPPILCPNFHSGSFRVQSLYLPKYSDSTVLPNAAMIATLQQNDTLVSRFIKRGMAQQRTEMDKSRLWEYQGPEGPMAPRLRKVVVKQSEAEEDPFAPAPPEGFAKKTPFDEGIHLQNLAAIGSPHILRLYGGNRVGDRFQEMGPVVRLFLEFCEGGDLNKFVADPGRERKEPQLEVDIWALFHCMAIGLMVMDRGTEDVAAPA